MRSRYGAELRAVWRVLAPAEHGARRVRVKLHRKHSRRTEAHAEAGIHSELVARELRDCGSGDAERVDLAPYVGGRFAALVGERENFAAVGDEGRRLAAGPLRAKRARKGRKARAPRRRHEREVQKAAPVDALSSFIPPLRGKRRAHRGEHAAQQKERKADDVENSSPRSERRAKVPRPLYRVGSGLVHALATCDVGGNFLVAQRTEGHLRFVRLRQASAVRRYERERP